MPFSKPASRRGGGGKGGGGAPALQTLPVTPLAFRSRRGDALGGPVARYLRCGALWVCALRDRQAAVARPPAAEAAAGRLRDQRRQGWGKPRTSSDLVRGCVFNPNVLRQTPTSCEPLAPAAQWLGRGGLGFQGSPKRRGPAIPGLASTASGVGGKTTPPRVTPGDEGGVKG